MVLGIAGPNFHFLVVFPGFVGFYISVKVIHNYVIVSYQIFLSKKEEVCKHWKQYNFYSQLLIQDK